MGRFSKLLEAKGKDVTIGDDVFNVKPLNGKHLGLFADADGINQEEATFALILASLQQTEADLQLDDVKELPIGVINELMGVITEVNELQ